MRLLTASVTVAEVFAARLWYKTRVAPPDAAGGMCMFGLDKIGHLVGLASHPQLPDIEDAVSQGDFGCFQQLAQNPEVQWVLNELQNPQVQSVLAMVPNPEVQRLRELTQNPTFQQFAQQSTGHAGAQGAAADADDQDAAQDDQGAAAQEEDAEPDAQSDDTGDTDDAQEDDAQPDDENN
jgi:hypothetical protein